MLSKRGSQLKGGGEKRKQSSGQQLKHLLCSACKCIRTLAEGTAVQFSSGKYGSYARVAAKQPRAKQFSPLQRLQWHLEARGSLALEAAVLIARGGVQEESVADRRGSLAVRIKRGGMGKSSYYQVSSSCACKCTGGRGSCF